MSDQFLSGVLLQDEGAWHGKGLVLPGTMPPAEAFAKAGALYEVRKGRLFMGDPAEADAMVPVADRVALYRPDNGTILGVVSPRYPIYPTSLLLKLAEGIKGEADMNAVVVLAGGKRLAFTSKIRGAEIPILPGDPIAPYLVGWLGFDGVTSLGGAYSSTRIVCWNTMQLAMGQAENGRPDATFRFPHAHGFETDEEAIAYIEQQMDALLAGIDIQRRTFPEVASGYQQMTRMTMNSAEFAQFIREVYGVPGTAIVDGEERPITLEMAMPKKWAALQAAYHGGIGMDIDGVAGTLWAGFNAITQVETSMSPRTGRSAVARRLHSTLFGAANNILRIANRLACARLGIADLNQAQTQLVEAP